jgi:hypothetical protein
MKSIGGITNQEYGRERLLLEYQLKKRAVNNDDEIS